MSATIQMREENVNIWIKPQNRRLTPEPETITIAGRSDDDTPPPLLLSSSDDGRIRSPCRNRPNDTSVLFMVRSGLGLGGEKGIFVWHCKGDLRSLARRVLIYHGTMNLSVYESFPSTSTQRARSIEHRY